jgi:hypothetical protein
VLKVQALLHLVRGCLSSSAAVALSAAAVLLVAPSCGRPEPPEVSRADVDEAHTTASEAVERAAALERRIERVEGALAAARHRRDALKKKLRDVAGGLRSAIERVRVAVADARAAADDAAGEASSAIARVRRIARGLAVLESRYNYHLRNGSDR